MAESLEELSETDQFCAAVFREERSYSKDLLRQALAVLQRVCPSTRLQEQYSALVDRVEQLERELAGSGLDDIPSDEMPGDLQDPITGTSFSCTSNILLAVDFRTSNF